MARCMLLRMCYAMQGAEIATRLHPCYVMCVGYCIVWCDAMCSTEIAYGAYGTLLTLSYAMRCVVLMEVCGDDTLYTVLRYAMAVRYSRRCVEKFEDEDEEVSPYAIKLPFPDGCAMRCLFLTRSDLDYAARDAQH
eukprot:2337788-Rhodomonas_salina.1